MQKIKLWSRPEAIIALTGLIIISLVATEIFLIQSTFARTVPSDSLANDAVMRELMNGRDLLVSYGWGLILLVLAMFVGLALMWVRQRRSAERMNQELEKKIAERASELAYERNLLRTLIDTVPDHIYAKDRDSRFILANRATAEFMGVKSPSELLGKTDFEFYPPELAKHLRQNEIEMMGNASVVLNHPELMHDLRGKAVWLSVNKVPLRNADGSVLGVVGANRDVTDQRIQALRLQEREVLYRSLVDAMPVCMFRKDSEGRIIYGNERFWAAIGLTEQDGLGKTDFDISPHELAERYRAADLNVMTTGETVDLVEDYTPQNGERHIQRVVKSPVRDEQGNITGVQAMFWDITEGRRQSEKLREREDLLTRILDTVADGIYIVDQTGRITYANKATERILGTTVQEIETATYNHERWQIETLDGKPFLKEQQPFERVMLTGEPVYDVQQAIRRPDASRVMVSINATPLLDTNGQLVGEVAAMTDITARKQAEDELNESQRTLAKAQEIAHIGSWCWDLSDDRIEWSNEMYRIFGVEPGSEVGTPESIMERSIHPDDRARVAVANERGRQGLATPMEYRVVHPDGKEHIVWAEGEMVFDADGNPTEMIGIVQDITERKHAEARQRYLAAIVESANEGIISKSLEGIVTSWNHGAEKIYGYRAEEMIGHSIDKIIPSELAHEMIEILERTRRGEAIEHMETVRICKDGTRIQVTLTFSPTLDEGGKINGVAGFVRDITARKRAEATLQRQNEYLDALHETTIHLMERLDLSDLLQVITQRAANLIGTTHGYIYVTDPGQEQMEMNVGIGAFAKLVGTIAKRGVGATGVVWETGRVQVIDDYRVWENRLNKPGTADVRALVSIPLLLRDQLIGVFGLAYTDPNQKFDDAKVEVLTRFGHLAAIALDNARLYSAAQEELVERKQAEEKFRSLFAASPDAIVLIDPNQPGWPIVDCNQVTCDMNGYTREELIGQSIDLLNTTPGTPEERLVYLETVRTAGVLRVEAEHRHKDGHLFVIETSTSVIRMEDKELVLGIDRDVTERKRVEKALLENRARIASLMNNTDDLIVSVDRNLNLTIFNDTFKQQVRSALNKEVEVGMSLLSLIDPESLPIHLAQYERAFAGERCRYETQYKIPGGPTVYIESYLNPIYEKDNEVTGLAIFTRDITERKLAEQASTRQKELLQTVFDNIPVMIGVFDAKGHYTLINREWERALGYDLAEMNQGDVMAAMYPDPIQHTLATRFMFAPTPEWLDFRTTVRGNGAIDTSWAYTPLSDGMTIAFGQDITKRKEVDRLKNEFISTVSHELRTPLTSIRGSLGLIAGGVAGQLPERAKTMLDIAYKNSERLVRLINDILDIEKIESGKMVFQFKPLELLPLIEQSIEANRSYGEQHQVTFEVMDPEPNLKINADPDRMTQVLTNLLSNAAKFSPPHGKVEVGATRVGDMVRVTVRDHGNGIPDEFKGRIFQKFAQADSSDTRQKGGTGLGLSIVKAIVEKHGGTIGFETEPGQGSTFFFLLPEYHEQALPEHPADTERPRILILEDDHDVAALLRIMLKQGGFDSDMAYDRAHATEMLAKTKYAAITLDLMLPDDDGVSFIRELRAREVTRELPIVVVSAKAEQGELQLNGDAVWVADWLQKPIDQQALIRAVANASHGEQHRKPHILHVEDDADVLHVVQAILQNTADVTPAMNIADARELLSRNTYDLILLDAKLPDGMGMDLLPLLRQNSMQIPVVIFSATENDAHALAQVDAALVKSRTSNEQLLETITQLIPKTAQATNGGGHEAGTGTNHAGRG